MQGSPSSEKDAAQGADGLGCYREAEHHSSLHGEPRRSTDKRIWYLKKYVVLLEKP